MKLNINTSNYGWLISCSIGGTVLWVEHHDKQQALDILLEKAKKLKKELTQTFEDSRKNLDNCNLLINMLQDRDSQLPLP